MKEKFKILIRPYYYLMRNSYYNFLLKIYNIKINRFDDSFFDNKRIIVIGPAESSLSYMSAEEIDKFDIVVRLNKSHLNLEKLKDKLGSKTDILFHCCFDDPVIGCGKIDQEKLIAQQNKFVVYPYFDVSALYTFYEFLLKNRKINLEILDSKYYKNIIKYYPGKIPTTGFQVLNYLLRQKFKELHITGFTFLKTDYIRGYRDSHRTVEKVKELVKNGANHNPDAEFELFHILLKSMNMKSIYLDETLKNLIEIQDNTLYKYVKEFS